MALIVAAGIGIADPFFYIGFGSMTELTSVNHRAGDPGRYGEVIAGWMYGLMGFVQLCYAAFFMYQYGSELIYKGNANRKEKELQKEYT